MSLRSAAPVAHEAPDISELVTLGVAIVVVTRERELLAVLTGGGVPAVSR